MRYQGTQRGFTLIELMIVVSIISILASMAIPTFQRYTIRAQIAEGLSLAAAPKLRISASFQARGEAPATRLDAGMTATATDTAGKYVAQVDIVNGVITITYGPGANANIIGLTFTMTPYETNNLGVVWRCGSSPAPSGLSLMGASGGGNTAAYIAPTVPGQYLPGACRP